MPSTIPYDPSLAIGNVVPPATMTNLLQIAALQAPVDAAQDKLNSFIAMKRSIDMTIQELINMNVNVADLEKKSVDVGKSIQSAAIDYASIRIDQETKMQPLRANMPGVNQSVESPLDYVRTQFRAMPLSADSIKLDAQYFSYDGNEQQANAKMSSIKSFITASTSVLGTDMATNLATSAIQQVQQQRQTHDIEGTLILTATCTHKQAQLLAPFILDVDKAVRVWNHLFKDEKDKIKPGDAASMEAISKEQGTADEKSFSILSGATFGSSFVGMVHVLRKEDTASNQRMSSAASSFQLQAEVGNWFENIKGGFGLDQSVSDDIKNLLSTQNITSHISIITMGCIPSITSKEIDIGVKQLAEFDAKSMGDKLATLQNSTQSEKSSLSQAASAARTGAQMVALEGAMITNVMSGLAAIDDGKDKMLNVNSMMTAFEDYVSKASAGQIGVPLNYYVKDITRSQIAQMWVAKYFPNKFLTISGDDSGRPGVKAPDAGSANAGTTDGTSGGTNDGGSGGYGDGGGAGGDGGGDGGGYGGNDGNNN